MYPQDQGMMPGRNGEEEKCSCLLSDTSLHSFLREIVNGVKQYHQARAQVHPPSQQPHHLGRGVTFQLSQ